ncbi:MAG: hypothetical protein JWL77_7114 [Chthonomonadaceae bacterium]|nr:hypothetical protein [Chthonomonadaceae bacterium]
MVRLSQTLRLGNQTVETFLRRIQDNTHSALYCCICMSYAQFPMILPCNNHIVCYGCIHGIVNATKTIVDNEAILQLSCPVCRHTCRTDGLLSNCKTYSLPACKLINSFLKQDILTYITNKCIFDGCCFHKCECGRGANCISLCHKEPSFDMEHIRNCGSTQFTCTRRGCTSRIDIFNVKKHNKECRHYECKQCGVASLSLKTYLIHKQKDSVAAAKRIEIFALITYLSNQHLVTHNTTLMESLQICLNILRSCVDAANAFSNPFLIKLIIQQIQTDAYNWGTIQLAVTLYHEDHAASKYISFYDPSQLTDDSINFDLVATIAYRAVSLTANILAKTHITHADYFNINNEFVCDEAEVESTMVPVGPRLQPDRVEPIELMDDFSTTEEE